MGVQSNRYKSHTDLGFDVGHVEREVDGGRGGRDRPRRRRLAPAHAEPVPRVVPMLVATQVVDTVEPAGAALPRLRVNSDK